MTLDWRQITSYVVTTSGAGLTSTPIEVSMSTTHLAFPSGLTKGTTYSVMVSTQSDLNESAIASISVFIPPDTTNEVENLTATSNATTIQVQWDPPSVIPVNGEIIRYRVEYENSVNTADNGTIYTPDATTGVVLLTDLSPGMEYRVTVTAENLGGLGAPLFILESTQNIAPQTRLSVTAVPIHPRSFRLEWIPVIFDGAPVTGYAVSVTATQGGSTVNTIDFVISDPTTSNFTFSNLSPFSYQLGVEGILYSCTMQVVNEVGTGPSSDVATTVIPPCAGTCDFQFQVADENCSSCSCSPSYTGELCDVPTFSPRNVQVIINPLRTSLTVTWEPPLATTLDWRQITGYMVVLANPDMTTRTRHVSMSTTEVFFSPIIKGSNETVTVSTQSDLIDSASTIISAFVPPDPPIEVSNLTATSNTTTIQVQWDPPSVIPQNGDVIRYRVDYQNTMDTRIDNGTIYTPDATIGVVFLTDLSPGTEYRVTVTAENLGGLGAPQFTLVLTQDNVCPMDSYGLPTDVDCTPCPNSSGSIEGTVNVSGCVCLPGYSGNDGGPCDPCDVGTFKSIAGNVPCLGCSAELSTSTDASTECDTCRFSSGNPLAGEMCYPFETTTQLETPQDADIQSMSISLSWQLRDRVFTSDGEDCCPVIGYLLWCTAARGLTPQGHSRALDIRNAVSTTATFTDLQPLVEYIFNITIMAQRNPGSGSGVLVGPPSAEITVITQSNGDSNSALPQITTITLTANNISVVSYTMNPDIVELITEFTLRIVNLDSGSAVTTPQQTPAPSGQITVLNINPQLTYQYVLQSTIGGIQYSKEKNMSFVVIPPPSDVTLTAINGTFVTITWTVLDGVSGYQIVISPATPDGTPTTITVIGGSVSSYGITELTPFLTYNIQVTGVGVDGSVGTPSDLINITTPEEPPGPPTNVQVVIIDSSLIEVRWSPPDMPNGIITEYIIVITPDDGNPTTVSVTSEQESITLPRPAGSFSVTVFAGNNAGQGAIQEAELVDQSGGSGDSPLLTIIIAASAGGSLLIVLFILFLIICCCCVYRKRGSAASFKPQYSGTPWGDEQAHIPGVNVTRDNELSGTRYKKLHGEFELTSVVPPPVGQRPPQGVQFVATNFNAEGMYEEVSANVRHSANHDSLSRRQLPMRPLDNKPPNYLDVVKEATPEDYDNEALYQSMEKFYFKDVDQSNTLAAFEVDRSKIKMQGQIGQGEFGRVVKGIAAGIITGEAQSVVAVKMLKEGATDSNRKDFLGEAQMLAHFKHPNVMGLVGVSTILQPTLVILPYMPNGDLKNYLKKQKELRKQSEKGVVEQFGLVEQLKIAVQIAKGMEYLASKFFIHRDLAARNVLVDEKNNVKISDFGLSRALAKEDTYYHLSQCMKLPVKWMALESIEYRKFSTYSDIWSFGVVLWEIFSFGATPYKGIAAIHITEHLLSGNRLSCPEDCPQEVYGLMRRCWSTRKEERTTFTQLKVDLMHIASSNTAMSSEEDAYY